VCVCAQVALADHTGAHAERLRRLVHPNSNEYRHDSDKIKSTKSCGVLSELLIRAVLYWLDYAFQKG